MNRQSRLSRVQTVDTRKHPGHRPQKQTLASYVNKGKVYPYASTKRGGKPQ